MSRVLPKSKRQCLGLASVSLMWGFCLHVGSVGRFASWVARSRQPARTHSHRCTNREASAIELFALQDDVHLNQSTVGRDPPVTRSGPDAKPLPTHISTSCHTTTQEPSTIAWHCGMSLGNKPIEERMSRFTNSSFQSIMRTSATVCVRDKRHLLLSLVAKIFLSQLTSRVGLRLGGSDFVGERRFHETSLCSGRCFRSATSPRRPLMRPWSL